MEYTYGGAVDAVRKNGRAYKKAVHGFDIVDYATASRDGRPLYETILARQMLPNVRARFCTVECKIRTTLRYLKSLGWKYWTNAIGFRADEPQRVAKLSSTNRHKNEDPVSPLWKAGVTKAMILQWWDEQPFKLKLQDHEGNCDLCFLKSKGKILEILSRHPEFGGWWAEMEKLGLATKTSGARFRNDRPSYKSLLMESQQPTLFDSFEDDELSIACHCTD